MAIPSCTLSFLIVISMSSMWLSNAYIYYVGGDDGWTLNPSKSYTRWVERNQFQIHDSIVFEYEKGQDSVLIVNGNDYHRCNKEAPIKRYTDGDSTFTFEKPGTYHFISGHEQNCEKGQKFIVVVLPDHYHNTAATPTIAPPSYSTSPSPAQAPTIKTESHSLSPSPTQAPLTNTPPSHSPSPSPTQSPRNTAPYSSPSTSPTQALLANNSPSPTQTPRNIAPYHSPSTSPTQAPRNNAPYHSPSPSPTHALLMNNPPSNSPSPSPTQTPKNNAPYHSPSPSTTINAHSVSPSPSNNEQPRISPTPSPAPTHASPHSNSPIPSPDTKTSHSSFLPRTHSPSPSPHSVSVPTKAPVNVTTPSPSHSSHAPTFLPSPENSDVQHDTPAPDVHAIASTPHYAPAPAPSAAPCVGGPFTGLVVYALMFSTLVFIVCL